MGALNMPSAADVERLTRRLRSVAQRLEGIEDVLDRLERRFETPAVDERLRAVEEQLSVLVSEVRALGDAPQTVPREQERLSVDAPPAKRRTTKKA